MKIGIVGVGHVGTRLIHRYGSVAHLVTYDSAVDHDYPTSAFANCAFSFICVGTPGEADGSADVSAVRAAVLECPSPLIVIRSTIPPGTTDALIEETGKTICFSPEYTGEKQFASGTWDEYENTSPFVILGGQADARRRVFDHLVSISGPQTRLFGCTSVEAEVVKYMENTYFAAKLTFVNEFARLCAELGADWHTVREGWLLDPRVDRDHTAVMPLDPGFEGRCLPKDLSAIIAFASANGYSTLRLLEAVQAANATFRNSR